MSRLPDQRPHYASLPREDELVLVTSVLGASASWLAQAFVREALTARGSADAGMPVVFVSFTRDWGFHAECIRKLGIDLSQHTQKSQFAFIDGLSRLFSPPGPHAPQIGNAAAQLVATKGIKEVAASIAQVIKRISALGRKPLLILENPDFLLAAAEGVGALDMGDMILDLRELSHSAIVTVNADSAFLHHPRTRLEMEHAAFVVTLAHNAVWTVGLRLLDTGIARDVSGVIRITRGPVNDRKGSDGEVELGVEEKEVLYYVGDGTVEVFDRGQIRG